MISRLDMTNVSDQPSWKNDAGTQQTTTANILSLSDQSVDLRMPAIIKSAALVPIAVISFIGNGIALATIRTTPKLRTKMYTLFSSLIVSDILLGIGLLWSVVYQLLVYCFNADGCSGIWMVAAMTTPTRYPVYVSGTHAAMIAIERYVAVAYPLHYESRITDNVIKGMIAFGWAFPGLIAATFWAWIGQINWTTCTIESSIVHSAVVDVTFWLVIATLGVVTYGRILIIAYRQKIQTASVHITAAGCVVPPAEAERTKKRLSEHRAICLTATVVGLVIFLWAPYMAGRLIQVRRSQPQLAQYVINVGQAIGLINSCTDWFIFGITSRDFRNSLGKKIGLGKSKISPNPTMS